MMEKNEDQNKSKLNKKMIWTNIVVAITIFSIITTMIELLDFFTTTNKKQNFNIEILKFNVIEDCLETKYQYEISLYNQFLLKFDSLRTENIECKIQFNKLDVIVNEFEAQKILRKNNAQIVIWGDLYEKCQDTTKLNIYFMDKLDKEPMLNEFNIKEITNEEFSNLINDVLKKRSSM